MDNGADRNAGKFAEPRSWAAKWCGYGLAAGGRRVKETAMNARKFAEPRGWSARWCSGGLGFKPRAKR
jgi:hypothetical protein